MTITRREAMILMAGTAAMTTVAGQVLADQPYTVQVDMWDKGAEAVGNFDLSTRIMLGTPEVALKDSAPMGLTPDNFVIPAGEIEFVATNSSKDFEHEMLVVPIEDVSKPLPYDTTTERMDEEAAGAIGEVAETEPGASGSVVLHLRPGIYMLTCNIPNHYAMGMWTLVNVV